MKKGIIIAIILCLLGMIFLSGSVGVFYKPVEVSYKNVILDIFIIVFNLTRGIEKSAKNWGI